MARSQNISGKTQESLLDTQMHKLMPGCLSFNKWFIKLNFNRRLIINEETIPTLRIFLERNNRAVPMTLGFWCGEGVYAGFSRSSKAFDLLVDFLRGHGFTEKDWVYLAPSPKGKQLNVFPLIALAAKSNTSTPFLVLVKIKPGTPIFTAFQEKFGKDLSGITVEQVLKLNRKDFDSITGTSPKWRMPYTDIAALRNSVKRIQKCLTAAGFTAQDGPFMELVLVDKKQGSEYVLRHKYYQNRRQKAVA